LLIIPIVWPIRPNVANGDILINPADYGFRIVNAEQNKGLAKKKHFLLWTSIVLLPIVSAFVFTSLGQNLLTTGKSAIEENSSPDILQYNPVFHPLARSGYLSKLQFAPGAHVIYNGDTASPLRFTSSERVNAQWWISDSDASVEEADSMPASHHSLALPENFVYPDLHPRLLSKSAKDTIVTGEPVLMGIADLLTFLREKDQKRQSEPSGSKANPFEKALTEANQTKTQETKETESATPSHTSDKEVAESKSDSAHNSDSEAAKEQDNNAGKVDFLWKLNPSEGAFLFIGAFNNQLVATDIAIASLNQLNESPSSGMTFNLLGAGKQTFNLSIVLRNRSNQESVALGDLNLDGLPDMVITNKSTNDAVVYLNNGLSRYIPSAEIEGGFGPSSAAISDFNQDGSPDVAVMLQTDKTIVVDGKGLRKFVLPTSTIHGDYSSMIPYDFNGDGRVDLLLTDYRNLMATIYLNCGKGVFIPSSSFALQSFSTIQESIDLDGDGINDLIYIQYLGDHVSIVMQNGRDGSIQSIGNMIINPAIFYILGDFNQDGVMDIAVAHLK
jgi:hypothetical protein